ncbi:MAG: hypothetical protein ACJAZ2_001608, partial [Glaciecola sp.]
LCSTSITEASSLLRANPPSFKALLLSLVYIFHLAVHFVAPHSKYKRKVW